MNAFRYCKLVWQRRQHIKRVRKALPPIRIYTYNAEAELYEHSQRALQDSIARLRVGRSMDILSEEYVYHRSLHLLNWTRFACH